MTIPAVERADDSDRLARTLELYRDLTVALRERITHLKAGTGGDETCKKAAGAVEEHNRVLRTVLDLEANLGKRRNAWEDGAVLGLDLAAARAEIDARLALRAAGG